MTKFAYFIVVIFLPVQALQILQSDSANEIVGYQPQVLDESSELSNELLLTKLEKSSKSGDARSQFSLANIYHNGIGVKTDEKLAFYWYTQVAEQGFASAQFNVANGYYHGIGTNKDLKQALSWYAKAAEQDFVAAQYNLAVMYRRGEGSEIDNKEAFRWYERAAQLGYGIAQLTLAKLYEKGVGIEKSDTLAQTWYLRAANQLDPEAQFYLAEFYQQRHNYIQAASYYRKASDQDYIPAQYAFAISLLEGKGVIQDTDKAQQLLLKTAQVGSAKAQFQLGKLLRNKGQVLEAREWLSKAREQAFDEAIALLANMDAIEQSKQEALELEVAEISTPIVELIDSNVLVVETPVAIITDDTIGGSNAQPTPNLSMSIPNQQQILDSLNSNASMLNNVEKLVSSAQQGNPIAQHNLSTLYSIGELVAKDDHRAFLLMQQSASQDIARSQNSLAMMYINGLGVEPNYQQAYFWASRSARQGDIKGKQILLYLVGNAF
ncbi:tetratricopeptide repeat protein [Candidatus Thioglobus sp.]|uniref:tetratricopeptide repeat protein n=1 Tax=Candidatus Thioglobus sp. TaxID=2026721 RepID=UPI00263A290B|nr:tetratricopeptide repeat protein [Candidatus Thioglobus sp.]MDG2395542.1 tetratricopeptide repeat protein [Candidatus Thioglobus sp.]